MAKVISNQKSKIMKNTQPTQNTQGHSCNCRQKEDLPLERQCLKKGLIYQATVKTEGGEANNYMGLTANSFKKRYSSHLFNFNHLESNGTTLSAYIWQLKDEGKQYEITWKILKHSKPFTPTNGQCAKEDYDFQSRIGLLNTGNQFEACMHKDTKLLYKKKQELRKRLRPRLSSKKVFNPTCSIFLPLVR